jgi:hypothetical protein
MGMEFLVGHGGSALVETRIIIISVKSKCNRPVEDRGEQRSHVP